MESQEPDQGRTEALKYGHLGIQFALVVGLLSYGGWWLDQRLGTTPLLSFFGLLAGFGIGLLQLYRGAFPPPPPRGGPPGSPEGGGTSEGNKDGGE